jgi:hypothetical protein
VIEPFQGTHSTSRRRKFWSALHSEVNAAQKVQGRGTEIDARPEGSVIHATPRAGAKTGGPGVCCTGFEVCTEGVSEIDCIAMGGIFRPGATCADDIYPCLCPSSINIAFSGITVNCGCVNADGQPLIATNIGVNMSDAIASSSDCLYQTDSDANVIHVALYLAGDCSGSPTTEFDDVDVISIYFDGTDWRIVYTTSFANRLALFYARVAGTIVPPAVPIANQITGCGVYPWLSDPLPPGILSNATPVGHGGTITIT